GYAVDRISWACWNNGDIHEQRSTGHDLMRNLHADLRGEPPPGLRPTDPLHSARVWRMLAVREDDDSRVANVDELALKV
ncbi:MAG: hypothetical protein ACE5JM_16450, partial [Armatimonadota bacterium]